MTGLRSSSALLAVAAALLVLAVATAAFAGRPVQAGQVCLSCWYATPVAAGHPGGAEDDCAFAALKPTCQGVDLSGQNLSNQDWQARNLQGANLSGSDLTGTNLQASDLRDTDLSSANLTRSNLRQANLSGAVLSGIRWSLTICSDGSNSDDVGGTCTNHLRGGEGDISAPGDCTDWDPRCGQDQPKASPGCVVGQRNCGDKPCSDPPICASNAATPTAEAAAGACSPIDPRCGSAQQATATATPRADTPTPEARPGCTIVDPRCP